MKRYKTLLFDVDGTLLDFDAAEENGLRTVFLEILRENTWGNVQGNAQGKVRRNVREKARKSAQDTASCIQSQETGPSVADLIGTYREVNHNLWDSYEKGLITKDEITDTRFNAVFERHGIRADGIGAERRYRYLLNRSAILVQGAEKVLEYLMDRYDLYVVTNGFLETQNMRMKDSGLVHFFRHSFISEEVGYQKPQKEFFDYCFDHIVQADRSRTLIIGDSLKSDILGGNNAGIDTCWYNPSGSERAPGITVDMEIRELEELVELL